MSFWDQFNYTRVTCSNSSPYWFLLEPSLILARESRAPAVQHCFAFEYPFLKLTSTGYFPLRNLKYWTKRSRMDTFSIVPTRVTHSRYSSEGARWTSVRAPRNPESQPPPRSLLNHSGERLSPWVTQRAEELAQIQTKYRRNFLFLSVITG